MGAEVAASIGATDDDIAAASDWLLALGARPSSLRVSALRDTVSATFVSDGRYPSWAVLSERKRSSPPSVSFLLRRAPLTASTAEATDHKKPPARGVPLKASAAGAVDPDGASYTVRNIKEAYGMPIDLQATNAKTLQMVWGPGTFGYSQSQLLMFKATECPKLAMSKVKFDTQNHGQPGGDNFGEGNLDVRMIASFGLGVETLVSNTNTSASTEEGMGFGQALLDFITKLSSRPTLPQVLSISLGSLSAAGCDLLCEEAAKKGYTKDECNSYLQQQRQVCMYLSQEQQARINTALQVLGARGVSVFGSSGDGGSHFSFGRFEGGRIADTLNEISCQYQMPVFPLPAPTSSAWAAPCGRGATPPSR